MICKASFSHVPQARPEDKKCLKPKGADLLESPGIDKTYATCNTANKVKFLCHNNKHTWQPRYQCLRNHQEFQHGRNMWARPPDRSSEWQIGMRWRKPRWGKRIRLSLAPWGNRKPHACRQSQESVTGKGNQQRRTSEEWPHPSQTEEANSPTQKTDNASSAMHADELDGPEQADEWGNLLRSFDEDGSASAQDGARDWPTPTASKAKAMWRWWWEYEFLYLFFVFLRPRCCQALPDWRSHCFHSFVHGNDHGLKNKWTNK